MARKGNGNSNQNKGGYNRPKANNQGKQKHGSSGKGNKGLVVLAVGILSLPVVGLAYAIGVIVNG